MKRVFFKSREAVAHQGGAMEAETISKNGANPKTHTSRRNFFVLGMLNFSILLIILMSMLFVFSTCDDEEETGSIAFWTAMGDDIPKCTVSIEGHGSKTITLDFSAAPECGDIGTATFSNLPYGTYTYTAVATDGRKWTNSIKIDKECGTLRLVDNR